MEWTFCNVQRDIVVGNISLAFTSTCGSKFDSAHCAMGFGMINEAMFFPWRDSVANIWQTQVTERPVKFIFEHDWNTCSLIEQFPKVGRGWGIFVSIKPGTLGISLFNIGFLLTMITLGLVLTKRWPLLCAFLRATKCIIDRFRWCNSPKAFRITVVRSFTSYLPLAAPISMLLSCICDDAWRSRK